MKSGRSPQDAVAAALPRLRGAFALAFLFEASRTCWSVRARARRSRSATARARCISARTPLRGAFTDTISYLEEGDWAVLSRSGAQVHDAAGNKVTRTIQKSNASVFLVDKGNHRISWRRRSTSTRGGRHTLAHYLDMAAERVRMPELPFDFRDINRISISACGTAIMRDWWRSTGSSALHGFRRDHVASEFRYREAPFAPGGLAISVSQSGETPIRSRPCAMRGSRSSTSSRS